MKNLLNSFVVSLLVLGACFHLSFDGHASSVDEFARDSLKFVQFSDCPSLECSADILETEYTAESTFNPVDSEFSPYESSQLESDIKTEKIEQVALKTADILTTIARLIIAISGAIFGIKKARE